MHLIALSSCGGNEVTPQQTGRDDYEDELKAKTIDVTVVADDNITVKKTNKFQMPKKDSTWASI